MHSSSLEDPPEERGFVRTAPREYRVYPRRPLRAAAVLKLRKIAVAGPHSAAPKA